MVIGNGEMAQVFSDYKENNEIVFFLSGVSNSRCNDDREYEREFKLLIETHKRLNNKTFVYFSTTSVLDPSLKLTKYIQHKQKIETWISYNIEKFYIFRIPTLCYKSKNNNLLLNFIFNQLSNNEKVTINKNSYRYILSIEDMRKIIDAILISSLPFTIYNIVNTEKPISLPELINLFMEMYSFNKELITYTNEGQYYEVEINYDINQIFKIHHIPFFYKDEYKNYVDYIKNCIKNNYFEYKLK